MKKVFIYVGLTFVAMFSLLALVGSKAKLDDFTVEFDDDL